MTTPDDQPDHLTARNDEPPSGLSTNADDVVDLITAASRPDVEPCDVCCEAMPAHLLGDLTGREEAWLLDHTAGCDYCDNELQRFQRVDRALDLLPTAWQVAATPPPPAVPRRPRAGFARIDSPIGPLYVAVTNAGICEIDFAHDKTEETFRRRLIARGFVPYPLNLADPAASGDDRAMLDRATKQLHEYFSGRRSRFEVPLDFTGVSAFTRRVLEATAEVEFGRLETYRAIATQVGQPGASRAVGNALGRNPIPVIVPCHRIIRSDASIGGYTGGLHIKQRLLAIEGVMLPQIPA
jgi:methylated-DNA-[protein]-cysteine S-methyltransferase